MASGILLHNQKDLSENSFPVHTEFFLEEIPIVQFSPSSCIRFNDFCLQFQELVLLPCKTNYANKHLQLYILKTPLHVLCTDFIVLFVWTQYLIELGCSTTTSP